MISIYEKDCPIKCDTIKTCLHLECSKPNEETISKNVILNNCEYLTSKGNTHHYTTAYLFNEVMPLLAKYLHIDFNKDDFQLVSYNGYDFHIPKQDFNVAVFSADADKLFCKSKDLHDVKQVYLKKCPGTKTLYQTLYVFMHRTSIIINQDITNDRILVLNCDSMISPLIPILAKYFKEIIILDNRTQKSYRKFYMNANITDYVCVLQTPNIKLNKEMQNLL